MKMTGNTILITGGAAGIGLALAERFYNAGNTVLVCGRRREKLDELKEKYPDIQTKVCDVANESDRNALLEWVSTDFPTLNILVNNAGIQQRINLQTSNQDWSYYHQEIAANLEAPIHLSLLFLPLILRRENASIINISSGLSITPAVWAPIYSATKAAVHSFCMSLRIQLGKTPVQVVEVFPPAVNTDLGGPGLHTFGAPVNDFADAVFKEFEKGETEIGYGGTERSIRFTRDEIEEGTLRMWQNYLRNNPNFWDGAL